MLKVATPPEVAEVATGMKSFVGFTVRARNWSLMLGTPVAGVTSTRNWRERRRSLLRRLMTTGTTTVAPEPAKMLPFRPAGTPRVVMVAGMPLTLVLAELVPLTRNAATRSELRSLVVLFQGMVPVPPAMATRVLFVVGVLPSVV